MNRNHVFDSSGPDLRIRGTSQQLFEKYLQLGRDATGSGDRVMAESYFQYAEHYFRILNAMNQAAQQNDRQGQQGGSTQPYRRQEHHSDQQYDHQAGQQPGQREGIPDEDSNGAGEAAVEARPIPISAGSPEERQ